MTYISQSEFGLRMARGLKAVIIGALLLGLAVAGGIVLLSNSLTSQAVQAPRMSLDMVTTGNTYGGAEPLGPSLDPWVDEVGNQCGLNGAGTFTPDAIDNDLDGLVNDGCPAVGGPGGATAFADAETGAQCTNSVDDDLADDETDIANPVGPGLGLVNDGCPNFGRMVVGTINRCLTTSPPGNNLLHVHSVHLVIQDVEDLIAWQAQLTYDGGKMRPSSANFAPFFDAGPAQSISFLNLPIDGLSSAHRSVAGGSDIPTAAPGPQTAWIGATYFSAPTFAVSPDSPAKAVPDDASYSAATGGVLATVSLQVLAGNAGQVLRMGLEDSSPTPPGSKAVVFTGTGQMEIDLTDDALFDGFHSEGVALTADSDLDGFSLQIECSAGTDPTADCPTGVTHDAWPADINNDTFSDISDIVFLTANFGAAVPPAPARYNVAPDPPDGFVDITDISRLTGLFGQSCL